MKDILKIIKLPINRLDMKWVKYILLVLFIKFLTIDAFPQCVGETTLISQLPINKGCSGGPGGTMNWQGTVGGTIHPEVVSNTNEVTWTSAGTFTLYRTSPCETLYATYTISAAPIAPSTNQLSYTNNCGQATLSYSGSVYHTYWQTYAEGTDLTYRHTRSVSSSGTYYARIKGTNGCWSSAVPKTVTMPPSFNEGSLTQTYNIEGCESDPFPNTITASAAIGTGIEYQWYRGSSPIVGATSQNLDLDTYGSNGTIKRKVRDNCNDWTESDGYVQILSATLNPGSISTNATHYCYGVGVSVGGDPAGISGYPVNSTITYGWQLKRDDNVSITLEYQPSFTTLDIPASKLSPGRSYTITRIAYLTGACTSTKSVSTTFNVRDEVPVGSISEASGCGSVVLNHSGTGTIYWQANGDVSSKYEGESGSKTVYSTGGYWYRVKDANGCWSSPVQYNVSSIPSTPVAGNLTIGDNVTTERSFYVSVDKYLYLSGENGTIDSYKFRENGGPIQSTSNSHIQFSNPTSSSIEREYWAVVQKNGCTENSNSVIITIEPLPAPTETVCVGEKVNYYLGSRYNCGTGSAVEIVSSTGGYGGNISDISGENFSVTWTSPGIYSFKRDVPYEIGCPPYDVRGTNYIQVFANPQSIPPTPEIISTCGTSIVLGYSGAPPAGEVWVWNAENTNDFESTIDATITVNAPNGYYLVARSADGGNCMGNQGQLKTIDYKDFSISSLPIIDMQCGAANQSVFLSTDDETDRWYLTETSTVPLAGSNVVETDLTYKTLFVERNEGICSFRSAYVIDATAGLKCSEYLNSVKTFRPQEAINSITVSTSSIDNIGYFDGIGRGAQNISIGASRDGNDIVQPIIYDLDGRESTKFLPFVSEENVEQFKYNTVSSSGNYEGSKQHLFYNEVNSEVTRDSKPYAVTVFEPSPLNRVLEQGSPGEAWQPGGGATVRYEYLTNELGDKVNNWEINT
ncbi:DUF6443 domain-containing protein, partial [Fulvivirga lutimaris]|uniref:DUF6443 domain-containing protein n=1 Tax=Fulvivirga lutimaris TaxID=1819566 RepID=UPI001C8795E2